MEEINGAYVPDLIAVLGALWRNAIEPGRWWIEGKPGAGLAVVLAQADVPGGTPTAHRKTRRTGGHGLMVVRDFCELSFETWASLPPRRGPQLHSDPRVVGAKRHAAEEFAQAHGVSGPVVGDVMVVVSELVTNALKYGGGVGDTALWQSDGDLTFTVDQPRVPVKDGAHSDGVGVDGARVGLLFRAVAVFHHAVSVPAE